MSVRARGARLRIVSWNVDGLLRLLPDGLAPIHRALGAPDVLCLQEVRVRPRDEAEVAAMESALAGFDCAHALCDDPKNGGFRGGRTYGVATYVRHALGARVLPRPSWDREGRVVAHLFDALGLVVGNVYAVNGTDKPHYDHARGAHVGDRHAFKRAFQRSVREYFGAAREAGLAIALVGDWNVSRTAADTTPRLRREPPHARARAELNDELLPALDVVDAFRELHSDTRAYTWFSRRSTPARLDAARVDFALVSRALRTRIVEASVEDDPARRFGSDHAPICLVLALAR